MSNGWQAPGEDALAVNALVRKGCSPFAVRLWSRHSDRRFQP